MASDEFGRVDGSGWGNCDTGETWTVRSGVGAFTVNGSQGVCDMGASGTRYVTLGVSAADVDVKIMGSWNQAAVGGDLYPIQLIARWTDTNHFYYASLEQATDATVAVKLLAYNGSSSSIAGPTAAGTVATLGDPWCLRFQVVGGLLSAKAWDNAVAEPGAWLVQVTDASLTAAGNVGVRNSRGSGSTASPVVSYDHFLSQAPASGTRNLLLLNVN